MFNFSVYIYECGQKSERVAAETNRASSAALNAEIRRTKARLMEEIAKLHKLAQKKVVSCSLYECFRA